MILIRNLETQNEITVSQVDKYIGSAGDNMFEERIFVIPYTFKGKDLRDGYTFLLQVRRPTETEAFLDLLEVEYVDDKDSIYLRWHIKRHDVEIAGNLDTQLLIANSDNDIVKQTFVRSFFVGESLDATKSAEAIPPDIFEQAVIEATNQAQLAKEYRDETENLILDLQIEEIDVLKARVDDIEDELPELLSVEEDPVYSADKPDIVFKSDIEDLVTRVEFAALEVKVVELEAELEALKEEINFG